MIQHITVRNLLCALDEKVPKIFAEELDCDIPLDPQDAPHHQPLSTSDQRSIDVKITRHSKTVKHELNNCSLLQLHQNVSHEHHSSIRVISSQEHLLTEAKENVGFDNCS